PSMRLLLYDRTYYGRVNRLDFWLTLIAYGVLFAALFEGIYRVVIVWELEVDSAAVQTMFWGWMLVMAAAVLPVWRLTRRRLHDAGLTGAWLALVFLPVVGWGLLSVLLALPTRSSGERFEHYAEGQRKTVKR
ncbi:MAG: DUF805 domain-containing protein, partial [Duodenibacillus sp.]